MCSDQWAEDVAYTQTLKRTKLFPGEGTWGPSEQWTLRSADKPIHAEKHDANLPGSERPRC